MLLLTAFSSATWLYLLLFRGGFWKADQVLPVSKQPPSQEPVAVIIPARNEAATIGRVVEAHRRTTYPGPVDILVADDHSDDGTADEARKASGEAPIGVVPVPPLPPGWSGKLWALHAGLEAVKERPQAPRYVLFTDADILVSPDLLGHLVGAAERDRLALVSVMAKLDHRGFWGGLLVPSFIFFFQKLYPFRLINDSQSAVAGAAGGVVLIRWEALERIGGIEALRGALIDDCTLAQKVKASKPDTRIALYLTSPREEAVSLRDNASYGAMEAMVTRTAYAQLGYNPFLLMGTLLGLGLIYAWPLVALLVGAMIADFVVAGLGAATLAMMTLAYLPTQRLYGGGVFGALTLPFAAMVYGWFTWLSGWRHMRGRGNAWKGRRYGAS